MAENTLKDASKAVTEQLGIRATLLERMSFGFKLASALGAFALAMAKAAEWPPAVTYVAASVVVVSALLSLIADRGASKSIAQARLALDKAAEQQGEAENARRVHEATDQAYEAELDRLTHLQNARDLVRLILEDVATSKTSLGEISTVERMLIQGKRSLCLALGFEMSDYYTICVYERVAETDGRAKLVCKAHLRAIECNLAEARVWHEGIGVAGIALAQKSEVVVPDLASAELGTLYQIPTKKPEDDSRYRSIVVEPIRLNDDDGLWGILIVTCSREQHFSVQDRTYVNVAQSLAGMISLAIKLVRAKRDGTSGTSRSPAG